jgi:hypothetical protein
LNYKQQALEVYRDSAMKLGLDNKAVDFVMTIFDTGFSAGALLKEDKYTQEQMIETLSTKIILN